MQNKNISLQIEMITQSVSLLLIDETKIINNLPFQINWSKNKIFNYKNINKNIQMFINCLQKPSMSWKEKFMKNIRTLKL
jgi:hypothetical protein